MNMNAIRCYQKPGLVSLDIIIQKNFCASGSPVQQENSEEFNEKYLDWED